MKQGWKIKPWAEVLEVRSGRNQTAVLNPNGKYPILGSAGSIMGYADDYLCEAGTTIIGRKGTIDRPLFIGTNFWNVDTAFGLVAGDLLENRFLYYFCLGYDFKSLDKGTTLPSLVKKDLVKIHIPIPPVPEQKRLVAKLDQAFTAIDQAKANVERNLQNAKDLFQSQFNYIFSKRDTSWKKLTLLELLEKKWIVSHLDGNHGGNYPRKAEFVDSGIPYISANCLKDGKIDFNKSKYLTPERAQQLRKGIAQNGDVLFAHNATVGPTALLQTDEEKVILSTSLTYYRCDQNYINPNYLLLYLRSKEFIQQYELVMRQSTRNQVPITKQRSFYHLIPPISVQNELVPKLKELRNQLEILSSKYQIELGSMDEMKKSILQKAFNGEL